MPPSLEQYVADANVIIDLHTGDLLELLPDLSFRIIVPDIIVENELLEPAGEDLLEKDWVQAWEFSGEELIKIQNLWGRCASLPLADVSALYLSISLETPLLTRDKQLRRAADKHNVAVLDTFWLLEEMLQQHVARPSRIALAFALMKTRGNFLPQHEANQVLARWGIQED